MKKMMIVLAGMMLVASSLFAENVTSPKNFQSDVNFDAGCVWMIKATKVTATAEELNAAGGTATALTTETNRAQVAEAALSTRISTSTNVTALLDARVVTETNRAQVAENTLSTRISTSTNVTALLDTRLVTETNRAQVAEGALSTRIDTATNVTALLSADVDVLSTNVYTKAEADSAFATAAQGIAATNAQEIAGTAYTAATNASQALAYIGMSVVTNDTTNYVVTLTPKNFMGETIGSAVAGGMMVEARFFVGKTYFALDASPEAISTYNVKILSGDGSSSIAHALMGTGYQGANPITVTVTDTNVHEYLDFFIIAAGRSDYLRLRVGP